MFKYKSPLSRLLEGAGKPKEAETEEATAPEAEKPEPIADFNALREALAGGNMSSSETYEDSDELLPEDEMPEFTEEADADAADDTAEDMDEIVMTEVIAEVQETPEDEMVSEEPEPEQVVTLHVATEETVVAEEIVVVDATPEDTVVEVVVEEPEAAVEEPKVDEIKTVAPTPAPEPASDRRGRVKTTFLGFERADTHVQDLIETAEPVAKTEAAEQTFPVGWLVVTSGPGRGTSVTLSEGLMQIGRNDDQAIQLDFGDTGISRSNHAVIAYDPEDRKCYLGHGGKANLVRLNGKPVLSTVALNSGDLIRISETTVRFTAFCDDGFDWRDA
ncbi:FHA domain protein [Ruegeria sp. THAF57]|uniref:FHA domain-containing protein n=1 Tax=Ruegeria sp. THAF57 TaxID=2744555 RepID=UPI0015DE8E3B|nr:FHA domain-containing protein [Ruegeria sp. THAF57]CAD0187056.1 FHA domain protein [Ruegeria sp. THAF57]